MNKNEKCDIPSLLVLAHHRHLEGGEFAWRGGALCWGVMEVVSVTGIQGRKPQLSGLATDWSKFRELAHVCTKKQKIPHASLEG